VSSVFSHEAVSMFALPYNHLPVSRAEAMTMIGGARGVGVATASTRPGPTSNSRHSFIAG